jgi:hypothetical protein
MIYRKSYDGVKRVVIRALKMHDQIHIKQQMIERLTGETYRLRQDITLEKSRMSGGDTSKYEMAVRKAEGELK